MLSTLEVNSIFEKIQINFSKQQFGKTPGSSSVSTNEAYKLLGLKKDVRRGCFESSKQSSKKNHPDMNKDVKTERLSQLVNEAKDKIIKTDFS